MGLLQPRWVYDDGSPVDYSMSIPQRPWDLGSRGFGGSDNSAAGVPSAYEIRRDYLMHLTLRFPVTEWDDVERLVRHLQRAGSATFYPDQDDTSVAHTVYGESPAIDEEIRPRRDAAPSVFGLDVSIRRTTEAIFTDPYFGDLLFHWRAGTTVTGFVFTRSSTGYSVGRDGVLMIAAANEERTEWVGAGFATPTLLLERTARTNGLTYSEQLNNAAWGTTRASVSADATTAPDGASTADKIVEDATASDTHLLFRSSVPAWAAATDQAYSFFMKAAGRTWAYLYSRNNLGTVERTYFDLANGVIGTQDHDGAQIEALADGWYRCSVSFDAETGAVARRLWLGLASADNTDTYNGDGSSGIYAWGGQFETDEPFASSYIQTVASTVTRTAEVMTLPYKPPPQELTALIEFIESGSLLSGIFGFIMIGGGGSGSNNRLQIEVASGKYRLSFVTTDPGAAATSATLAAAPSIGDTVELRLVINADGSILIGQSINGAAETTATGSAIAIPPLWREEQIHFAPLGTFSKALSAKVARGIKTMPQMRALVS